MMDRAEMIRARLTEALSPESLEVVDRSHEHAGHEGAKGGGGHFDVIIVADAFEGMNSVARHRTIYDALGDAMRAEIHALSIRAYTPEEF
ncbi:MAG TPA: BolA family transcriptional regulator [Gammaproteobacteria bacterium]|nr:BolA family transcriptional regulator [Gammaproteobacteria bacterium]